MNAPTPRGRKARRVALSPESLEDRVVPAGNVLAFLNNGVLHVWGDGADNRVWLAGAGEDAVVVATLDGTTINGGRTPVRFEGVGFAYDVQLRDGNDFLLANDLHGSASLFVQSGDGNDGVAADRLRLDGSNVITTGTGDDTVSVGLGKMKWGAFTLGAGDDRMQVFGTEFGDVVFSGGTGAGDTISVVSVRWGSFPHTSGFESVFGSLMPVANNDRANVDHGESVTINVLANDLTAGGGVLDPSSVRITKQPQHGTVTVNADGTITYTSDDNSTSPRDSFRYTVRSSTGAVSNEATVTLVLPVKIGRAHV